MYDISTLVPSATSRGRFGMPGHVSAGDITVAAGACTVRRDVDGTRVALVPAGALKGAVEGVGIPTSSPPV
jgi:hypothetical protein